METVLVCPCCTQRVPFPKVAKRFSCPTCDAKLRSRRITLLDVLAFILWVVAGSIVGVFLGPISIVIAIIVDIALATVILFVLLHFVKLEKDETI